MKYYCAPLQSLPRSLPRGISPIALYDHRADTITAGTSIVRIVRRLGIHPDARAWDFLSIALSIAAADGSSSRDRSPDGWTRRLDIKIAVQDPGFWSGQSGPLCRLLGFLTGDEWTVGFVGGGATPTAPRQLIHRSEEAVTLLSGGLDSFIGTVDLAAANDSLAAVSQVADGDKSNQRRFAQAIGGGLFHFQANHNVSPIEEGERSQRGRSLVFIAFGVLVATALEKYKSGEVVTLYIPENGFISLNIPLTPTRLGSLSTRTTHPNYMRQLQALLTRADLRVNLFNPYQFKTKGEMIRECRNQALLRANASSTTSCGRYKRNGFTHCGRCVPCLIRRAAFHHGGIPDGTKYKFDDLSADTWSSKRYTDVRAAGMAVERVRREGLDAWIGGALNSAQVNDVAECKEVARRGLKELEDFLSAAHAL